MRRTITPGVRIPGVRTASARSPRLRRGAAALGIVTVLVLPAACKGGGDSNGGADGGTRTNPNSAPVINTR